ncbi:hypothetical protein LUZ61_009710 [Rhynchospora tenuis]|uniref:Uncharacterized protein n=1 Tax=Rhynchospora tenuis TaxID=198213 RepID=A0AAD5ZXT1_9POAL|nr:hypothetical protein LUZ61_009710 [Rhynchospora tenuis]
MGSRADSESYIPPRTYGMAGPMIHLCYDEREDHLHGYSDTEKEMLKRVILEHEVVFRGQVHELHKLWRVQRDLMLEYERNPFQRNSSLSPIPPPQHSTNDNNSVFYSNQSQPNFEFVREGSAQSSANIVPAKPPMFDLQLPANEYIGHENGMENESGLGKSTVSCFDKSGVVCSANWVGNSTRERILLSDLNEPVKEATGLDFLGVNRDRVLDRRADEGSSSGLFSTNRKRANEELFLQKEKGDSSSGLNFFNRDRNHQPNFTPGDSLGINFFSPYRSHQRAFQDQHAVVPQLFGQKLTFNFDQSQAQSNHIFSSNNSTSNSNDNHNNNSVGATSFPVLDSSPHYGNSNKNKGLIEGSIHPLNPFFTNIPGTATRGTTDGSGFSMNAPHDLIFGSSRDTSFDLSKSNCEKNFNSGTSMDLNEPIPEANQVTKGIKLFGSSFGGLVSEADWQKNKINLNNTANEDELSQKASSSASVVVNEPNSSIVKLLGFPFFGNSSSNNKPALHVDGSNKSQRSTNFEHAGPAKQAVIDLNDLPLENDLDSLIESKEGKIVRCLIDLEMPASQFEDPNTDVQQHETGIKRESGIDLSVMEAANNILAISQVNINAEASSSPVTLLWFADLAVSGCDKLGSGHESESEDLFESMTLKLEEVKSDDRFGTGNFCERKVEGESSSQAGESGYTSLLFTRGRRGPARKRRQRRDFQRDVLPTIASLSRVEVTEDLQMIGGLMRACGQELDSALTRRVGRSCSNAKGKRQQRSPQVNQSLRTPQVKQPDKHPSQTSSPQFPPQGNLPQADPPVGTPPHASTVQRNHHVNPLQRIPKANRPQKIPPVMNQQATNPFVNQPHGVTLMGPPQNVSLDNQQLRTIQPNQPQKVTLVNQAHRFKLFNQRQKVVPISASQNMPPVHQSHGVTELRDMALMSNQPQRSVQAGQSHTSVQAIGSQSVSVANQQQIVIQSSDIQSEGLCVIGWGRTTERRNRRPRGLPPASQKQQPGNNNPPVPSN